MVFPDVVGPDFGLAFFGEVRGEEAADRAATDDTDFQQSYAPRVRAKSEGKSDYRDLCRPHTEESFLATTKHSDSFFHHVLRSVIWVTIFARSGRRENVKLLLRWNHEEDFRFRDV